MVGLVVVSHSRALARAAVDLAREMVHGQSVRIEVAAGLDEEVLGTDAVAIGTALVAADDGGGDGVVVLMDLGSAVLSAELALDLADDDALRSRVTLCAGPLVEGLVVAAVTAASGASREEVAAEALGALAGKQAQLAHPAVVPGGTSVETPVETTDVAARFTVVNRHGLHARPAARLVQELRDLDATVRLRNLTTGAGPVPGGSLSRLATLGAVAGHEVEVTASGPQARAAVEAVVESARRGFDDPVDDLDVEPSLPAVTGGPMGASPGVAVGPAWSVRAAPIAVPAEPAADPDGQEERLRSALAVVADETRQVRARAGSGAAVFDAHLALLADDDLLARVRSRLGSEGAAPAWAGAIADLEAEFAALPDPYLAARAADVRAVGDQVLRALLGLRAVDVTVADAPPGVVLVAPDLTPAQAAAIDPDRVAGVVLAFSAPTAHSAILARARGVPAVVGAGAGVLDLPPGTLLALDGDRGELVIDPDDATRSRFAAQARERAERAAAARAASALPATTRDGVRVVVAANVGSVVDAQVAAAAGADGAGLVRTEFLFAGRATAPDVDEQEKAYLAVAEALGGARITLRTLDVGGDKPLDYVPVPPEANPFLGLRGLRLALARPGLLRDQLTAVVRAARLTPVSVMFPMVTTVAELVRARELLDAAVASEGGSWPIGLEVGLMIEVPASALRAAAFGPLVDFLSVGTNDLTQYTLAVERGNDAVAALGDPLDPAVLQLIAVTCAGAGRPVGVCGELAGDERAAAVLLGLGVRELSVAPPAVATVKQAVRAVDLTTARDLAARAVQAPSAEAVRALLPSPPP